MKGYFSRFILLSVFLLLACKNYALNTNSLLRGYRIQETELKEWIKDCTIKNTPEEIDKWLKISPESFKNVDLCKAYYNAGLDFYNEKNKMLALQVFLKGFSIYTESPYKKDCAFYAAKIFYQINNKESALHYINRAIDIGKEVAKPEPSFTEEAIQLKRRIRWDYISSYEGIPDDSVSDIAFDGDDIWISMWTGGVARFTRSSRKLTIFFTKKGGLESPHTRCIQISGNRVWIGTYAGLFYYDKKIGKFFREKGNLGKVTIKKLRLIDKSLYAATLGRGLYLYDNNSGKWKNIFSGALHVTDVLKENGGLYIATLDKGLFFYSKGKFENILRDVSAKTLCYVDNKLWVGTHGKGIFVLDLKGKIEQQYSSESGLTSDYIEVIRNIKNTIVIGTLGGGANFYMPKKNSWAYLNILTGLPSNDVVCINFEKNHIWFGTLSGGIGILLTEDFEDI